MKLGVFEVRSVANFGTWCICLVLVFLRYIIENAIAIYWSPFSVMAFSVPETILADTGRA